VLLASPRPAWVKYHNIVGKIPETGLIGRVVGGTDGVVSATSAHLDNVESEIVVNADHSSIHRHALSVLEVQRILLTHLAELKEARPSPLDRPPITAQAPAPSPEHFGAPPAADMPFADVPPGGGLPAAAPAQFAPTDDVLGQRIPIWIPPAGNAVFPGTPLGSGPAASP
jgi:hypothetical protein